MNEEQKRLLSECGIDWSKGTDNLQALDLRRSQAIKNKTVLVSDVIGSREDRTYYFIIHDEIECGCFRGTLEAFESQVHSVYQLGNKHRAEYDAFILQCKALKQERIDAINALLERGAIEELIKSPQNWTNDERRRVVACSKSSYYEDIHNDMLDAIAENSYYEQAAETEREQRAANKDLAKNGHPSLSARERNGGRF